MPTIRDSRWNLYVYLWPLGRIKRTYWAKRHQDSRELWSCLCIEVPNTLTVPFTICHPMRCQGHEERHTCHMHATRCIMQCTHLHTVPVHLTCHLNLNEWYKLYIQTLYHAILFQFIEVYWLQYISSCICDIIMFQLHVFDLARTLVPVPTLTPTNFVVYDIDHQPLPRMYGLSLFRSNDVTSPKYTNVVQGTVEQCQTFSHSYKSLRPLGSFKPGMNRMYGNCFVGFLQDSMKDAENLGPSDLVGKHPSPMIVASGIGQWRHGSLLVLESVQRIDIMRERNVPSLHNANPLHCRFNSLSNAFPALATPTAQTPAPEFQGRTMKNIAACCMSNVSSTLSQRFARTEVVGESWITPSSCVIKDLGTCMIQIHYIILYHIIL